MLKIKIDLFHKANQVNISKTIKERQELKNSLIAIQEMGVIQILLDLFLLIQQVFFREAHICICNQFCSRFYVRI